ncbi:hypothetical protein PsorP6_005855 [Peronosclerospora sorghi]|uniref:Uncharacterized protein n=1 Tax=Peronosclerospora sorghi TaxID=230839 RepID=A0ACC0W666_9STRA|nr:hypothetical protein PsorP6_005855 [Peronosclerospora sorghi]
MSFLESCGGAFTQIYAIPCYHEIRNMKRLSFKITKDDFHPYWHFERPFNGKTLGLPEPPLAPPGPVIFKPHVVITRGRRRKDKSTRRDPSALGACNSASPGSGPDTTTWPNWRCDFCSNHLSSDHRQYGRKERTVYRRALHELGTPPTTTQTYIQEEDLDNELLAELVLIGNAPSATQAAQSVAQTGEQEQAPLQPTQRKRDRPKGSGGGE